MKVNVEVIYMKLNVLYMKVKLKLLYVKVKSSQSRYRPGVAQRVPKIKVPRLRHNDPGWW
jgi:hypothetical protein